MHKIDIPDEIRARALRARGREHIIEAIDPAHTAHIVVDLQMGFMAEGAPVEVPAAREIVPAVNRISAVIRKTGGLNVFLRYTADPDEPQSWSAKYENYLSPRAAAAHKATFARGATTWQLWPTLDVQVGDLVLDKTRFSAFVPDTCALHDMLQQRGIDTVIVTGTLTNVCCESTARDAMQRNYKVVFVTDGNGALSDAEHNATLANLMVLFADLRTAAETIALIASSKHPVAAR